ncbi:unannotated protein [freshwater metagenome]|uniref:Unannotated protein n=1 Tax=freshwater metagenome TaxID=449393 RepID=A0A6J6E5V1_9ZZZZ
MKFPSASPSASPRRRIDLRLVVGILLVVSSTAGAYLYLSSANSTVDMYLARETLLAGDAIRESDLELVAVSVSSLGDTYLAAGKLPDGAVATRAIASGELVPARAVGSVASVTSARLVVAVAEGLPADTLPGTSIDVWATTRDPYSASPSSSSIVVAGATFVRALETDAYAMENETRIELMIPRAALRGLLGAQGDGASLIAVPTVSQAG